MLERWRERLTYANVMSTVGVFLALGGTATAAKSLISGRDVRDGSLTGRDIKNRSLTEADLARSVRSRLRGPCSADPPGRDGAPGPVGPRGERGQAGDRGPQGAA